MDTDNNKPKVRRRRLLLPRHENSIIKICHSNQIHQKDFPLPHTNNNANNSSEEESTYGTNNNCNKRTKYSSLLAILLLKDHKRTNNNRIGNVSKVAFSLLVIYTFVVLFTFLNFASADDGNRKIIISSSNDNDNNNNNANLEARVGVPLRVSTSYAKAYNRGSVTSVSRTVSMSSSRGRTKRRNKSKNNDNDNNASNSTQIATSISRPFYTKITSGDAVAKPSNYYVNSIRVTTTTKKPPKTKKSKMSSEMKPSKLFTTGSEAESPHVFDTAMLMTSSTEKSFINTGSNNNRNTSNSLSLSSFLTTNTDSGPKIRLEPFFNLLTSFQSLALGTSKEQKFSPSYQTITQSIDENTKASKAKGKGTKGMREKKRKNRYKNKTLNSKGDGPIPIPIPKSVIDPEDEDIDGSSKKPTLHPLDILNVPMSSSSSSSGTDGKINKNLESITMPNRGPYENVTQTTEANSRSAVIAFDQYHKTNLSDIDPNLSAASEGPESRERRLRSGADFLDNFRDKDVDLEAEETAMEPDFVDEENTESESKVRPNSGQHVNIPQGYTSVAQGSEFYSDTQQPTVSNSKANSHFSTIYPTGSAKTEDINMISKYPMSFAYNPNGPPPPPGTYRQPHYPIPVPFPKSKLRPNLHSYYDQNYHNYAAYGENNDFPSPNPYGPPYNHPSSGYGNMFSNNHGNNYGSHYVGHTLPIGTPNQVTNNEGNNKPTGQYPPSGGSSIGTTLDLTKQGTSSDTTLDLDSDNSIVNNNQKIGVMNSFEIFYKEYKVLTWAAFFVVTSLALLCLLVYFYVNNPPTEVVTARNSFLNIDNIMHNPQIIKFLTHLVENNNNTGTGRQKRKKFKKELSQKPLDSRSVRSQLLSSAIKKDL